MAKKNITNNESNKEKFMKEIEISSKLDHPSIIRLLDIWHDHKNYYIVTELFFYNFFFYLINIIIIKQQLFFINYKSKLI